jgi:hypothetical protein
MDDSSTPEMGYVKSQIKFLAQEAHGLELQVDGSDEALSESIHDLEGFLHWVDKRLNCYEKAMVHLLECHIPKPAFYYSSSLLIAPTRDVTFPHLHLLPHSPSSSGLVHSCSIQLRKSPLGLFPIADYLH